ncbi:Tetracenomycin polyketide synthesis O-methyltransferase TcmP [Methanosarcina siciliae C2J]|uniref:Tetracenomycin polyketide synthesis O-methyltransferase TcmP n=1 Tax=Methanosarcina siciliae C2J TaxID=1434118 RepID=A0A0E3PRX5_9EURY|nr:Tetracenomycin polyketide synthesis O-methyltransferase TcmP [Methanosarcina siciliae C2J]
MQQTKIKVNLSGMPLTSLVTLYSRAKLSKDHASLFNDVKAVELVEKIDYCFSLLEKSGADFTLFANAARAMQLDNKVKAYIKEHPQVSVINLGAGFETEFYRVDNGTIRWYDLDLPELIEVRKQLLPETDRSTCIAKSFLDPSWCQDINTENGLFMIAGGLFRYFGETEVRQFFSLLADRFPGCEIVFEAESESSIDVDGSCGAYGVGWNDDEPEKRDAMQAEYIKAFENAWKMFFPQAQKDMMIGALTTSTRPQSAEWDDFETWWDQLSAQEKGEAMSDFFFGFTCKCPLEDASEMVAWDDRITVVDQFPLFRGIPRDPSLSLSVRQFMDYTDEKGRIKIFHMRL